MSRWPAIAALAAFAAGCDGRHDSGPPTAEQLLKTRPYTLRVPPTPLAGPAPLVLGLHGYAASSTSFEAWWKMAPAAAAAGVFYAALDGQVDRDGCSGHLASTGATLDFEADLAGAETAVSRVAGCPAPVGAELWTVQGGDHHPNLITPAWGDAVIQWLLAHPKP